ncbi:acetyltransferase [Thermodesulfobacteriota bacterium]
MVNIVVVGSSGHAKVVIDVIEKQAKFSIVGLIDSLKPKGESCLGYKTLGTETDLPLLVEEHSIVGGIVAIGDNWQRHKVVERISMICPRLRWVTAIHPSVNLAKAATVGNGTVIMAGASINSSASIGNCCIINTNSSVDHDNVINDFASLAPGVTIGGKVRIGQFSAISLGANVIHGVSIGVHSIIGAGATVLNDIPSYSVALGTPAKVTKKRNEGDKYL